MYLSGAKWRPPLRGSERSGGKNTPLNRTLLGHFYFFIFQNDLAYSLWRKIFKGKMLIKSTTDELEINIMIIDTGRILFKERYKLIKMFAFMT